jgi:hypothetical protein
VTDEDIFAFVRASVRSVWALELLLLLRREPTRAWHPEELVRELRSSHAIVAEELSGLQRAGLAGQDNDGRFGYTPLSPRLDDLVTGVQRIYAAKPMAVVKAIMAAPNEKLRIFSDAFKLKE